MRRYQSKKTGTILGAIDGGGLGDGVPRGNLRLVSSNGATIEEPKKLEKSGFFAKVFKKTADK